MKTTIIQLTFLLLILTQIGNSQITVNSTDFFKDGDYSTITLSNNLTTNATPGPNKTWTYTSLDTLTWRGNYTYSLTSATLFGSHFPTSNITEYTPGDTTGIRYYLKTSGKLEEIGYYGGGGVFEVYSNSKTIYKFPITYNDHNSDKFISQQTEPGSWSGYPADSLRYITSGKKNYKVDSWGSLTLPTGTFDALRISDTTFYLIELEALNSGVWSFVTSIRDTMYSNNFVSNNPHAKREILVQSLDKNGIVTDNFWSDITPGFVSVEENQQEIAVEIFPNPATNYLTIQSEVEIKEFAIQTIAGKVVKQKNLDKERKIDISEFPAGLYIITLKNDNSQTSRKFIKE